PCYCNQCLDWLGNCSVLVKRYVIETPAPTEIDRFRGFVLVPIKMEILDWLNHRTGLETEATQRLCSFRPISRRSICRAMAACRRNANSARASECRAAIYAR